MKMWMLGLICSMTGLTAGIIGLSFSDNIGYYFTFISMVIINVSLIYRYIKLLPV